MYLSPSSELDRKKPDRVVCGGISWGISYSWKRRSIFRLTPFSHRRWDIHAASLGAK